MTARLRTLCDKAATGEHPLLMCALVAGDPYVEASAEYLKTLAEAGADLIEVIVPFSDPTYHGPVIQRACERALREELTWSDVRDIGVEFRKSIPDTPLIASSYYNRILSIGQQRFAHLLADAGFDGAMVTDLPAEEAGELRGYLQADGLALPNFVAPTTSRRRLEAMAAECDSFFIWTGHSGGELTLSRRAFKASMEQFRAITDRPIVASMKISSGVEAAEVVEYADGVLVGSAVIWLVEGRGPDVDERLGGFVRDLRGHLEGGAPAPDDDERESDAE